jgi:hypothetical protein
MSHLGGHGANFRSLLWVLHAVVRAAHQCGPNGGERRGAQPHGCIPGARRNVSLIFNYQFLSFHPQCWLVRLFLEQSQLGSPAD